MTTGIVCKKLDADITAKGLKSGWLDQGKTYVGPGLEAAQAFGASDAFGDEASVWLVIPGDKPMAMEVRAVKTPSGKVVWVQTNYITPC